MTGLSQAVARALLKQRPGGYVRTGWSAIIKGELASSKNSRKMAKRRSRTGSTYLAPIKSDKARGWLGDALSQVMGRTDLPIALPVVLTATIYYASRRPDLDDELLMDFLQAAGIILNDRQIVEKHIYKRLDPADPRVDIDVRAA